MSLIARAPGLWTLDHDQRLFGMRLGSRMTVARLNDGSLWLHSPVPIDDATARAIDALGPVAWIVAPNLFHHLHVGPARLRWPAARLAAPAQLGGKRPDLTIDHALASEPPPAWAETFSVHGVGGMPKVQERVFFHRATRTLIVTDLLFNIVRPEGLWSRLALRLTGASGGPRQTRYLRAQIKDRAAFADAMRELIALGPEAVILCHGDVIPAGGAAVLTGVGAWVLAAQA